LSATPHRFTHLHVHSHYSLLDGNPRIKDLVQAASNANMDALALTDHGNLHGMIEFIKECRSAGIKPIPGIEAYIARKSRTERTGADAGNFTDHITLLAADQTGYKNLMKLSSSSYIDGFYRKPRIDKELLGQHREGLIALSGCLSGEVARAVLHGTRADVVRAASSLRDLMGRNNFFLEVMNNGLERQQIVRDALEDISTETGIPLVATSDVHYLRREDHLAQEVQLCIGTGTTLSDPDRMRMESDQFFFRTAEEMTQVFPDLPDAVARTQEIASRCNVELMLGQLHLPEFTPPDGSSPKDYFHRLCREGLNRRYPSPGPQHLERLERESKVIEEMGFVSYFLVVFDFIRFARDNGIPVGPGRGSAAGSIVAYVLGITDVDPLRYDLLFERFLNSSRVTMPDIDIDFCRDGRERVIQYVRERYGADRVSQIVTFGTMAARAAIRDVGRVLDMELSEVDRITKKIPGTPGTKLAEALKDPELKSIRDQSELHRKLFDVALKLEGLNRHTSTHAAGVVIGDQPLREIVPLCTMQGEINTQFSMGELEDLGLLKMDFLGLKTLTIMDLASRLVERSGGKKIDFPLLVLDDPKTLQLLQRGETIAVFQLESSGMRELLVKMSPSCFEDIIAILALFRPGPLGSGMVDSYVNRKRGVEKTEYLHPALEGILRETKGILVYQEQVMRITNVLAGFTLNEADTLRKAMGKKLPEVMQMYREKFIEGAAANGCDRDVARLIWEQMEFFAGYGFNKSHSTAYGLITYWTAYLKANHPKEFMAAVISCEISNSDKVASFLTECRRMGIKILPPNLSRSEWLCTIEVDAVRLGLSTIKGLGEKAIDALIKARAAAGPSASIETLIEHVQPQAVNRAAFEALIKAGALDYAGHTRAGFMQHLEVLLQEASRAQKDRKAGQKSLFDAVTSKTSLPIRTVPSLPEWPQRDLLHAEKEVFGFYLSSNPLSKYADLLRQYCTAHVDQITELKDGATVTVGGIAGKPRITVTKKGRTVGRKMAIFDLNGDAGGAVSCVTFPDVFERCQSIVEEDRILLVTGQLDLSREDQPSIKVSEMRPLQELLDKGERGQIVIDLPSTESDLSPLLQRLHQVIAASPGQHPVFLRLRAHDRPPLVHRVATEHFVTINDDLIAAVERIVGHGKASVL